MTQNEARAGDELWQATLRFLDPQIPGEELHRAVEAQTDTNSSVGDIFALITHPNVEERTLALLACKWGAPYRDLIKSHARSRELIVAINCGWELDTVTRWNLAPEELRLAEELSETGWEGSADELRRIITLDETDPERSAQAGENRRQQD